MVGQRPAEVAVCGLVPLGHGGTGEDVPAARVALGVKSRMAGRLCR
jgi:hypothetical protein